MRHEKPIITIDNIIKSSLNFVPAVNIENYWLRADAGRLVITPTNCLTQGMELKDRITSQEQYA
jgi:hypothetical protein